MKTIEIYACYGITAHEKLPTYRTAPSEISDKITVKVPDGMDIAENCYGDTLVITADSAKPRRLLDILDNTKTGKPCLRYANDKMQIKTIALEVVSAPDLFRTLYT